MEDTKLEAYYNELKAAAPKGGRGGLGTTKGPKQKPKNGFESVSRPGENGLYSMFVKEGQTGYVDFDETKKIVEDVRVGLIPCLASTKKSKKVTTSAAAESSSAATENPRKKDKKAKKKKIPKHQAAVDPGIWSKHCKAVLKPADGKKMRFKILRNKVLPLIAADKKVKADKAAVKAAWPENGDALVELLGPSFVVAGDHIKYKKGVVLEPKKRKADADTSLQKESKKQKTGPKGNSAAAAVAEDKAYKWKKHSVAALGEAGAKGLKLRKLQKDVAKRVLGSKKQKAIDAMKAAGGPESWATLVGAAAKLVVTPEELGLKFTISGGYVKLA